MGNSVSYYTSFRPNYSYAIIYNTDIINITIIIRNFNVLEIQYNCQSLCSSWTRISYRQIKENITFVDELNEKVYNLVKLLDEYKLQILSIWNSYQLCRFDIFRHDSLVYV